MQVQIFLSTENATEKFFPFQMNTIIKETRCLEKYHFRSHVEYKYVQL